MKISRRNFIRLGGAAAFVGANFLTPVGAAATVATAAEQKTGGDALSYLTAADFKKYVGTKFSLTTAAGGTFAAVLTSVAQVRKTEGAVKENLRGGRPVAEAFTLSFKLSKRAAPQATYRLRHSGLGAFDLFLVPEADAENSLCAVINRI
jgi:hypothetical protein